MPHVCAKCFVSFRHRIVSAPASLPLADTSKNASVSTVENMSGSGARRKSIRRGVKKTCRWHVFSLRSRRLYPVAVPKILLRHLSRQNFDRCHSLTSLFLPLAALGSLPAVASIWFCTARQKWAAGGRPRARKREKSQYAKTGRRKTACFAIIAQKSDYIERTVLRKKE